MSNVPGKLVAAVPVLPTTDLKRTVTFFAETLGFEVIFCDDNADDASGAVQRDGVELHFFYANDRHLIDGSGCRMRVADIEALYARCLERSVVHANGKLEDKPWGFREFTLLEPEGIIVTFFQPIR